MKRAFNRTAEDDLGGPSLDYKEAIAEFYREFPEHKHDVFILNPQNSKSGKEAVAEIAGGLDALQVKFPQAVVPFARSLAAGAFEHKLPMSVNITGSLFSQKAEEPVLGRIVMPAGDEYSARLLKAMFSGHAATPGSNARFPVMDEKYNNTEMWHRYVLDHELGHAVTMFNIDKQSMKVSSLGNKAECEADAYSMIRHYQRYGHDSAFPELVRDLRNFNAVHKGDVTHWTSRALDEVIELNKQGKLDTLTPQQARDLAVDIAKRTHLSSDAEYNMMNALQATVQVSKDSIANKTGDGDRAMNYLEKVCALGAATQSPAVLDACQRYFASFKDYVPATLSQSKTEPELQKLVANANEMNARVLDAEPPMDGLKRAFRDAMIDFSSGKKPERKPPAPPKNNKPDVPKAA